MRKEETPFRQIQTGVWYGRFAHLSVTSGVHTKTSKCKRTTLYVHHWYNDKGRHSIFPCMIFYFCYYLLGMSVWPSCFVCLELHIYIDILRTTDSKESEQQKGPQQPELRRNLKIGKKLFSWNIVSRKNMDNKTSYT